MQIKTFAEACKKLKTSLPKLPTTGKHAKAMIAYAKLLIIAEALNEGWQPDWNNYDEYKYYPWFYLNKPGFRFYGSVCSNSGSHATCGSRLCFKSRELSDYAGKQFLSLWEDMMVIPKKAAPKKKAAKKK